MNVAVEHSLPARIGRYEVLAQLAMGGMAEILLARVRGPSGFERAVVIKRILPHCARIPAFVSMFLDEARIAARIHHPNVVHVQELGREGEELFLVMEYLQGESTASIMRRTTARRRLPSPVVCAHVIGEACAGLHAAHELTDATGRSVGLVHRDVSPQNIFVTYDGSVKVLDFGIAKAADRLSHTDAGTLKGKFDYMSPEQAEGLSLDRRSDLFSLGIVLYEMCTGRRLFKRGSQVESLRAVREAPIVPPSHLVPGFPPALEAVCMRALERAPERRYQTAAEMRRALGEALRASSTEVLPEEQLAATMQELFGDRVTEKQRMMDMVAAGTDLGVVPTAEVDLAVDIPEVRMEDVTTADVAATTPFDAPRPPPAERSRPRWPWVAAAVLLAVGAGAGWALTRGGSEPARDATEPPAAPAAPHLTTAAAPAEPIEAAGRQPPPAAEAADAILLRVESEPPGARLLLDGEPSGETPTELRVPRSERPVALRLERDGYQPLERSVIPEMSQLLQLSLERERRPARPRRRVRGDRGDEPRASDYFRRFE